MSVTALFTVQPRPLFNAVGLPPFQSLAHVEREVAEAGFTITKQALDFLSKVDFSKQQTHLSIGYVIPQMFHYARLNDGEMSTYAAIHKMILLHPLTALHFMLNYPTGFFKHSGYQYLSDEGVHPDARCTLRVYGNKIIVRPMLDERSDHPRLVAYEAAEPETGESV